MLCFACRTRCCFLELCQATHNLSLPVVRSMSAGLAGLVAGISALSGRSKGCCASAVAEGAGCLGSVLLLTGARERQAHPVVKLRRADAAHMAAKVATSVGRALATPLGIAARGSPFAPAATPDQPELDSRCARPRRAGRGESAVAAAGACVSAHTANLARLATWPESMHACEPGLDRRRVRGTRQLPRIR
jgi:hypothetical protein